MQIDLRVVHVIPHVDELAAGPAYSVVRLAEAEASLGWSVELCCARGGRELDGVKVSEYRELGAQSRLAISLGMIPALLQRSGKVAVIHNHSLWSFPNIVAGFVGGMRGASLVTSPRGTLSARAMRFSTGKKRAAWWLQRPAIASAACLHATSIEEADDFRNFGCRNPIAVIPNGIDVPKEILPRDTSPVRRKALFLGRIHPIKGLESLIDAWSFVHRAFPEWELDIVGKGDDTYTELLNRRIEGLGLYSVRLLGPMYGEEKALALGEAELFVLPSQSENFGMAVAEALSFGTPVIATLGTPWSGLVPRGCGWHVQADADAIASALRAAMSKSAPELASMGLLGRRWMISDFNWPGIAERMTGVYQWLSHGGSRPDCVIPAV